MSTSLGLFHAKGLGNCVHYIVHIYIFLCSYFKMFLFFCTRAYKMRILFKQTSPTHTWIQTGNTNTSQSGPGNNGYEIELHIDHISKTGASLSKAFYCHIQDTPFFRGWGLLLCRKFSSQNLSHGDWMDFHIGTTKSTKLKVLFFLSWQMTLGLIFSPGWWDRFVSQSPENLMRYIFS